MAFGLPTRRESAYPLVVGMSGVQMGDRLLQIGCANGGPLAAVAAKVGLSGRSVVVVADESSARRARKAAVDAGVLVEVEVSTDRRLPFDDRSFNVAILDNTGALMSAMPDEERAALVWEVARILEPGGRVMVISRGQSGLGAWLGRAPSRPPFDPQPLLQTHGFSAVRLLAEREGLIFVEGLKRRV